jgi:hypothetical protein
MPRRKHHRLTQKEFQWILSAVVFFVCFVVWFVINYFSNCIFHWPPRWDAKTCWNEQVVPSKEKAAEAAANFIP